MTLAQKVGQLFAIGLPADALSAAVRSAIATYHFGSVWFTVQTAEPAAAVRSVAGAVQAQATLAATDGIGFFVAANQEGGTIQALSGPGFSTIPSALSQGTVAPSTLTTEAGRWGAELKAAGVNLDFAPVADVVPAGTDAENAPIGQLQREYGHDTATVGSHVVAFVHGMAAAGVATTVKHFPGLGRVVGNTDFTGQVTDSATTATDPYLEPFAMALAAGAPFVMVSLATYERIDPADLTVFSSPVIEGMLRGRLGFTGVVISDDLGAAVAVASIPPADRATQFLAAGGDMIASKTLSPAIAMARALTSAAATDTALRARIDAAVRHVLAAKEAYGLLRC